MTKFSNIKDFSFGEGGGVESVETGLLNWIRKESNGWKLKTCHNQISHFTVRSSRSFPSLFFVTSSKWSIQKSWAQKVLFVRKYHCVNTNLNVSVCIYPYSDRRQGTHRRRKNKMLIVIVVIFHCCSLLQHRVLEYFI